MIKIDEGKFNAKGDYFKLTTEFEVLCRCFREMLVERLGEDDANAKFDELIANSKMAEEERLKLVKENFSADVVVEEQEFAESKTASQQNQQKPVGPAPDNSDGFMNIPDGIDEVLPFN